MKLRRSRRMEPSRTVRSCRRTSGTHSAGCCRRLTGHPERSEGYPPDCRNFPSFPPVKMGSLCGWYRWASRCRFYRADLSRVLPRWRGRDDPRVVKACRGREAKPRVLSPTPATDFPWPIDPRVPPGLELPLARLASAVCLLLTVRAAASELRETPIVKAVQRVRASVVNIRGEKTVAAAGRRRPPAPTPAAASTAWAPAW